jgi:hypothetical protein
MFCKTMRWCGRRQGGCCFANGLITYLKGAMRAIWTSILNEIELEHTHRRGVAGYAKLSNEGEDACELKGTLVRR